MKAVKNKRYNKGLKPIALTLKTTKMTFNCKRIKALRIKIIIT